MKKKIALFIGLYVVGAGCLHANDFRSEDSQAGRTLVEADTLLLGDRSGEPADGQVGIDGVTSMPDLSVSRITSSEYALDQPMSRGVVGAKKRDKRKFEVLPADSIRERKRQRGLTSMSNMFVPQGQWVTGINASFSTHSNDNYTFVVVEGINSEGYSVNVSPLLGYAFRNNMVIGARFIYSRTFQSIDKGGVQLGDEDTGIDLQIDTFYSIKHTYQTSLVWRQYIPLGQSKRFALFNEMQLAMGSSQAKFAEGSPVRGTYETGRHFSLGITPGLVAFATNNMAIELNVGIMGVTYSKVRQIHNQVTVGTRKSSMMNFKVNIFSIGIGVAFYL